MILLVSSVPLTELIVLDLSMDTQSMDSSLVVLIRWVNLPW